VTVGDKLIGLASNGLHSNGYSLVRKVLLDHHKMDLQKRVEEIGTVLGDELLRPTKIYVKVVLNLMKDFNIGGIAHITGGGITDNLPRIIPKGYKAVVHSGTWEIPPVFSFLKDMGSIPEDEMLRTFNNGIGMILIVRTKESKEILDRLHSLGQKAFVIGEMEKAEREQEAIEFI
jgi:phosphoribosylformylglycinamidine cyclo-ligase